MQTATVTATIPKDAAEMTTDCHVLETDRTHLNHEEHALLQALLRPGALIEAIIPEGATPDELWRTLDACVRGLGLLEARICRLKPIIGRILLIFENKPSLYKELGFETYSDFMNKGVYGTLGLHRSSAYEGKLAARDWPQLTPDNYVKIGPKRLNILNKAGIKGGNSNAKEWLDTAASMKVTEFGVYMEQRGFLAIGESSGATISITTNRSVYTHWKEFSGSGRIHSVVGSKDADKILEAMMQACEGDWLEQFEREKQAKFEKQYPQEVS